MHELSIALSMLDIAQQTMDQQPHCKLVAIHIRLGPMSGVVREALESAYEIACAQSPFAGAKLVIEETKLTVDCPQCGVPRDAVLLNDLRCRICGQFCGRLVSGREMEITALEVEDKIE